MAGVGNSSKFQAIVRPEDLVDMPTRGVSVSDDKVRGQEREVAKF